METLLFIRHAETDLAGRFCGHSDPPVNQRGQAQIKELLNALEGAAIEAVYTSDLARSLTTAHAVAEAFGLSPVVIPGLREIYFGDWEGLTWQEIEARDPSYAREWSGAYPSLPAPGGESFDAFRSRVLAEVDRLLSVSPHRRAAVVTHGGVLRVVLCTLSGLSEDAAWERSRESCAFFRYPSGRLS